MFYIKKSSTKKYYQKNCMIYKKNNRLPWGKAVDKLAVNKLAVGKIGAGKLAVGKLAVEKLKLIKLKG